MIPAFLTAAVISFIATYFVVKLAWKWGLVDDPKKNKHPKVIHDKPTPRGGGLAIFISLFVSAILFLPLDVHLTAILAGATLITAIGLLDDKYNLSPHVRLGFHFLIAALPVAAGITIKFTSNPMGGILDFSQFSLLPQILAVLWIVFMINILNLGAKGVPGQLTGVTIIAASIIAYLSLKFSADIAQWPVLILASITVGAFSGFLPWHIEPQKIMPSFSGSNLAGYFLAIMTILTTTKIGTLLIILAIPVTDTLYVIVRRIATGKHPFFGDRGHLHHRLLDAGFSKNQVAIFYCLISALLGILAVNLNTINKLYTIIAAAVFTGILILWLTFFRKQQ